MEFFWSDECAAFRDEILAFAREELVDDVAEGERTGRLSHENWGKCAKFGIHGLSVPPEYGGRGADILKATAAMEALGYGCRDNGLLLALSDHMWMVQLPILEYGTEEQKRRFLPGLCRGELIGAHGMTEEEAGSDAYSLRMKAVKRDGGYVLNGEKVMITLAPIADLALVYASVDASLGKWGISIFLVERGTPGFTAGPVRDKMGLRTVPFGNLTFRDCFVPDSHRLGREGAGVGISSSSLEWERSCLLASQVGAMHRQLDAAVRFAGERRQFDQPIGKFQAVSNRIADMKVRLEAARLFIYRVAWLKKQGRRATMEAAMAKLVLAESFAKSSLDAVRTYGGRGYLTEYGVERDLRDAVGGLLYGGTSDIQRNIIARMLGL